MCTHFFPESSHLEELFSECYHNSEDRAFALLVRRNRYWSKTTCLHLAKEADTKSFFAHDGVQIVFAHLMPTLHFTIFQAFLTKIWWGDMSTSTPIWKLICGFWCPLLIYTNLISFSEETQSTKTPESFKELDSLDAERSLLFPKEVDRGDDKLETRIASENVACATFVFTQWKKFWTAPVTVFMGNVIMYFAFLFLFAYVILVNFKPPPPEGPSILEIILYFWVFTLVLEEIRQDGRTILAIDFMVFTLRLIHIFAIHKQLGPKIIIVERMMKDVFFFLFFLSVWLIAYGVTTQALLHPADSRAEWIFRRVLYRPYLQIFGQIPLDEIDSSRMNLENCTTNPLENLLEDAVLCPNVVQGNADIFWKFQRYNLIVEYHGRPAFAPPFIIIDHIKLFLRRIFRKTEHKKEHLEKDLPEGLDQQIITWEMLQKENYLANLETKKKESNEERLKKMSEKVNNISKYFSGLKEQEKRLRSLESQINYCTVMLSSVADNVTKNSFLCNTPVLSYTGLINSGAHQMPALERSEDGEFIYPRDDDMMYIDN
ncbi:hypothetical protein lerEdw1_015082 [Lerista edwardsae]|nr:hypothetical protein lerEdw1_015085 [Lerista edwardsae]KAJ6616862.1 hypothetical protein lerEdw1_015082 [Lerista edwardsae]